MSTRASRWSTRASSASSSAARAAISRSPSPGALIGLHPVQQGDRLTGVAPGSAQQIDGDLAEGGHTDAVADLAAVEDDVVVAGRERNVRPGFDLTKAERVGCRRQIADIEGGQPCRCV